MKRHLHMIAAGCCLVLLLSTAGLAWSGGQLFPLRYLRLTSGEGEVQGELLIVQRVAGEQKPSATVVLVAAPEGELAELSSVFDPDQGVSTERLVDRRSGWWAELETDIGFSNLGAVDQGVDPSEWAEEIHHRARQHRAPTTHTLRTVDGAEVTWTIPWGMPEEERGRVRNDALAELATEFATAGVPSSAALEVAVLRQSLRNDERRELSGVEDLAKGLSQALAVADRLPPVADATVERMSLVAMPPEERSEDFSKMLSALTGDP